MAEGVNVRLSGKLKSFIADQSGSNGLYESASEYVRDLIRRDYQHHEGRKWNMLYEQLSPGMTAKENEFVSFNPDEIIKIAKKQKADNAV